MRESQQHDVCSGCRPRAPSPMEGDWHRESDSLRVLTPWLSRWGLRPWPSRPPFAIQEWSDPFHGAEDVCLEIRLWLPRKPGDVRESKHQRCLYRMSGTSPVAPVRHREGDCHLGSDGFLRILAPMLSGFHFVPHARRSPTKNRVTLSTAPRMSASRFALGHHVCRSPRGRRPALNPTAHLAGGDQRRRLVCDSWNTRSS